VEEGNAMSVDNLLSRLNKVKRNGTGSWMAQCPCHADKTASLAIKDCGDGRILINCFALCDTYSILRSVGLDWADVLPESTAGNHKPVNQVIYASEALKLIQFETRIVLVAAYDLKHNKALNNDELARLELAMQRINKAVEGANV
jgi:hypothetical protein